MSNRGKDDKKDKKSKPVKTWPFPRDMDSDFAMLEVKSEEINNLKVQVVELVEQIEKQESLLKKMAESAWDQVKEALAEEHPEDEKLIYTCVGLHIVTDERLNIRTKVEAFMPDGAPKELVDEDDVTKVNLTLREAGTDDKTGAASGPSTTNTEEMFKKQYWRDEHGEQKEDDEVPDEFPDELKLEDE